MQNPVKIKSISKVTHDVLQIETEKPAGFTFTPGQATEISINKSGWQDKSRPFTFTNLPADGYLQFTIKTYPSHKGVTNELLQLKKGDELILHDVFGAIAYKGEGVFIAGGAGVTPFIAIFKELESKNQIGNNKLIFANKTKADIIHEEEFKKLLGNNFVNILSEEKSEGYASGFITEGFLRENIDGTGGYFYICGPDPMINAIVKQLASLNVAESSIVREAF